jgi:Fe2+ or Zn2+ uptake regulation protein
MKLDQVLTDALRSRGQRVTLPRLMVHRFVARAPQHVTAEDIHEELPSLSFATIYSTLDLLEELGLVRRVATETGTAVYDPRTEDHHHLVCRICGEIVDVDAPVDRADLLAAARKLGFAPDDAQVVVRGVCANCAG